MAAINFYPILNKKNKNGLCPVAAQFTFNRYRIKKATGVKVLEKHWNNDKQRVKPSLKAEPYNNYKEYNSKLDEFQQKAQDIFNYALLNNIELTDKYFNKEWEDKHHKTSQAKDYFAYYDEYIEINKPIRAQRTIMGHTTAYNFLKEFADHAKLRLTLEGFDMEVFERFRSYCFKEKGISDNYFNTHTSKIKAFMSWALERGYHKNHVYQKFKAPEKQKEIICLYKEELFTLYNFQFENKRLEKVRDVYCFGCFTGFRFSDLIDLKREHIKGDEIQKVIVKTREFSRIPLNRFALEILEKYRDNPHGVLPKISEQKFNDYIKEACRIAGIDSMVSVTTFSGGKVHHETVPKYKLITSHTARKTFTTNSLILGMNETIVKKITGHKKDENFRRYVRLAEDYVKEASNDAWNKL